MNINEEYKSLENLYKYTNVLFGASGGGRVYYDEFKRIGIKVHYFCDNDINKIGNNFSDTDINIVSVSSIPS